MTLATTAKNPSFRNESGVLIAGKHAAAPIPIQPQITQQETARHDDLDEKVAVMETAIRNTGHSALSRVRIDLRDGMILIQGHVSSYYYKQLCQEAIRPLAFGLEIQNQIEVQNERQ